MNAVDLAKKAYGTNTSPVRTPRNTEYAAFARVTQKMRAAAAQGRLGFGDLARAIHENRQLWSILAIDVADRNNRLPHSLRGQIFYLAEFVAEHSRKVLKGDQSVEALVEINTAVMRGLAVEGTNT